MKKVAIILSAAGVVVAAGAALTTLGVRAQTVQGDILRGQGRFLEGAGWYNFNTARADRINVETWKEYNREVQRLYRDYMIDRALHIAGRKDKTDKLQKKYQREFEEAQRRYRDNPNPDDITSGNALNALAIDLADPTLGPSSWRGVQVALPPEMSLTSLAFTIADLKKARISQPVVAIDRMLVVADKDDKWPIWFRRPEILRERTSYQNAIKTVVDKCRNKVELQASDCDQVRTSVAVLGKAVETAIPTTDNQRGLARDYVRRLDKATRIFAEAEYAEQLIRDVSEHKATNIAELLAFMREYRLLFADPGDSPEVVSMYQDLYSLLRKQRDALGLRYEVASDVFAPGSVWANPDPNRPIVVTVKSRQGRDFEANWVNNRANVRNVFRGEVGDDTVYWRSTDVRPLPGGQPKAKAKPAPKKAQAKGQPAVTETRGSIKGNEIHFNVSNGDAFVLRRK
jgi:hypothetical protein